MNLAPLDPLVSEGSAAPPDAHQFFVPLHYEANYAYPLIVWLHGPEDDHRQVRQVMQFISTRNYVAVAPRAPGVQADVVNEHWADPWQQTVEQIAAARDRVALCIERAMARYHIAPHRVFIAGYDQGGTMALRIALDMPKRFAGVASLQGPLPRMNRPMWNFMQARRLPVLISHGRDNASYPIQQLCDELRLFHVAGMSLNLRQYPCDHELTALMLTDLNAWMMQIVTGVEPSSDSLPDHLPRIGLN
jgi:phospholipase/carboxylesterase